MTLAELLSPDIILGIIERIRIDRKKMILRQQLGVDRTIPDQMLRDLAIESGIHESELDYLKGAR